MNNLFYTPMQNSFAPRTMPMTRAGEPLAVDGFESVKTIQTLPNTITIAFHKTQNILYRIETDANNHPSYRFFNYSEMETPIDRTRTATLEDLYNMKEDLINEYKHFWNESTASNSVSASATANEGDKAVVTDAGSKSNSGADASNTRKQESSIW